MLFGKKDQSEDQSNVEPIFGSKETARDIPKYRMPEGPMNPVIAYRLVKDELLGEGTARQNLATFCQTYMEPEAQLLLGETLEKNAIDKSEYPRTAEIENRCVNIIADLWNTPDDNYMGTSTVGSSEACMLGGMAMKFRWRNRAKEAGIDVSAKNPNLIISSGYQVCWEKFCVYWDVEMRVIPMDKDHMSLDIDKAIGQIDEYTIGVVGILGITYTGNYDDIEALDKALTHYNRRPDRLSVPIHVDAASGGLFAPFMEPDLRWDFRLDNVVSINTSGHKYGLVYPGIGWIVWREPTYLPEELIFKVSYLGGEMPTMAINFSRSASQIIGQYYNFLRFGFDGYKSIHTRTRDVAVYLSKIVVGTGLFKVLNDCKKLPIVCYRLRHSAGVPWTLYDLSDRLQMKGWQAPTYPLPEDMQDVIIQRFVVRGDFSMNMAVEFAEDFKAAIDNLAEARVLGLKVPHFKRRGFTH
jgi:glutamate decarboxylase